MPRECPGCNQPMIDGKQWFYGPLGCHLECKEATIKAMGEHNAYDLERLRINERLARDDIVPGHHLFEKLGGLA